MDLKGLDVPPRLVLWGKGRVKAGPVLVGLTKEGELCRVSFLNGREVADVLDEWHRHWVATSFKAGKIPKIFDKLPMVMVGTELQRRVLVEVMRIPYGDVASYGEIAERIEMPGRARAVGRACKECVLAWVIPCHRVVAANGLGGFGRDGTAAKEALLKAEGITF